MKKEILGLLIVLSFFSIIFTGCLENTSKKETINYALNSSILNLDDLPEGYIKWSEESNYSNHSHKDTIFGIKPLEFYFVTFAYEPEMNNAFPAIALYLYRFNSSSDAKLITHNLSEQVSSSLNNTLNRTTPPNVSQIGDESIYELFEGNMGEYYGYQNATWSNIHFRIENITVYLLLEGVMEWDINYVELTLEYARIIEDRINKMLS